MMPHQGTESGSGNGAGEGSGQRTAGGDGAAGRAAEPGMGLYAQAGALHRPLLLVALVTLMGSLLLWASRRHLLLWLERQELRVGILLFTLAFTLISFPWSWGYTLLSLAPGYLYGFQRGLAVVVLGVAVGTLLAHLVTKRCLLAYMITLVRGNAKLSTIVRVLDGTSGLKVVFLARLTPIPFGLQNAVFAISKLETVQYLATSTIGLLPSQILNSYLGSTVRTLEDVVNHRGVEGYLAFALQIFISVVMMLYFVRRARQELNKTIEAHNANQPECEALPNNENDLHSTKITDVPRDMDLV
ncbi:transmembrane protein 64-like [Cetorhinus maximus]